jgi:hypothetical protein
MVTLVKSASLALRPTSEPLAEMKVLRFISPARSGIAHSRASGRLVNHRGGSLLPFQPQSQSSHGFGEIFGELRSDLALSPTFSLTVFLRSRWTRITSRPASSSRPPIFCFTISYALYMIDEGLVLRLGLGDSEFYMRNAIRPILQGTPERSMIASAGHHFCHCPGTVIYSHTACRGAAILCSKIT